MNTILVNDEGQVRGDAFVQFFQSDGDYMAIQGDASDCYPSLNNFSRTLITTGNVTSIYDHIEKTNISDNVSFILNYEHGFHTSGNHYQA
ncbi:MAG: hypothetical protein GWN00_19245, partial [Aliifodinibius sp.]|nr:hypothetical protein [Fodinibius sp.]NIV13197.1 hypothetical protein [Fodinibius sp.]NIY26862.1 hypothetical protein [Fodinibius sp.]